MQTQFSSKVDSWLIPVMVLAMAGLLAALIAVLVTPTPWPVRILVAAVAVAVILLLFSVFRATYYVVSDATLRVVSGPFRWTIPLADITAIVPTRNPLSSPALSFDRLKISYGKRRFVLVSPADKDGFMRAIEKARETTR